jgi:membrane protein
MKWWLNIFKAVFAKWSKDNATQLAASLAFFAILSLAPLLLITVAILGLFFGEGEARHQIEQQAQEMIGGAGAEVVSGILQNAANPGSGVVALVVGFGVLLFAASNIFIQLQMALNRIWDVAHDPKRGFMGMVKDRLHAFMLVLGVGLLFLASFVARAALSTIQTAFEGALPGTDILWAIIDFAVTVGIFTVLFAVIFKVVPSADIRWHDVWVGAAVTAVLFAIGRGVLGWYLGRGTFESAYGAAGSVIVLLVWIFYSTQIMFFGAEFTQVYAKVRGENIPPDDTAIPELEEREYHQQRVRESIAEVTGESSEEVKEREPALAAPPPHGKQSAPGKHRGDHSS